MIANAFVLVLVTGTLAACSGPAAPPDGATQTPPSSVSAPTASDMPEAPPPPPPSTETSTESVFALDVGECLNDDGHLFVEDVPKVDCGAPHDFEVFASLELTSAEFDLIGTKTEAEEACKGPYAEFVGLAFDDSVLDLMTFHPTANSWMLGDRRVSCLIGDPGVQTAGSLRGALR
jgi:hypothetical protein